MRSGVLLRTLPSNPFPGGGDNLRQGVEGNIGKVHGSFVGGRALKRFLQLVDMRLYGGNLLAEGVEIAPELVEKAVGVVVHKAVDKKN